MKKSLKILSLITLAFLFLLGSCDKENANLDRKSLSGKWILTESLADIGNGKGTWKAVPKKDVKHVEFKADGALSGDAFPDYISYTIKDSVTISMTHKNQSIQNYTYRFEDDKLSMSPAGPMICIEGCGSRFEKIQ